MLRNPFITGAGVGAGVMLVLWKRHTIASWFHRAGSTLSGAEPAGVSPWALLWTAMKQLPVDERPLAKVIPLLPALPALPAMERV